MIAVETFFVGGDGTRLPDDLWYRFYRLDIDSEAAIWAFCTRYAFIPRRRDRRPMVLAHDLVPTVRRWHRRFAPLTERILSDTALSSAEVSWLGRQLDQQLRVEQEERAGGDGSPAAWLGFRLVTHDLLAVTCPRSLYQSLS